MSVRSVRDNVKADSRKAGIQAGDDQLVEKAGKTCCFTLMKSDEFGDMVRGLLGPMMKEVMASDAAK